MIAQNTKQDNAFFTSKTLKSIELITLKSSPLFWLTSFEEKEKFLSHLDQLDKDSSNKIVILCGLNKSLGKEGFWNMFNSWSKSEICTSTILKICKALDQIELKINESPKIFISVQSGKVTFPFFSLSLACDYRIIASNYIVQNPELIAGLVPKGGGAFFLSQKLGTSSAFDLMLARKDLTAYELLRLKLVDKVVEFNKLHHEAIEKARDFASKPFASLSGVKRLVNCSSERFGNYLELENDQLLRALNVLKPDDKDTFYGLR
jgi:2-(1,2-epoxy-1,2-dihydrophenyl)acetyl-CoA isomerase